MIQSREVILHVGLPKTGTTALQFAFYSLREKLALRDIAYPNLVKSGFGWTVERGMGAGNGDIKTPNDWVSERPELRIAQLVRSAVTENPNSKQILISSEVLSPHTSQEIFWKTLGELSNEFNTKFKIVAYVRDPLQWFISIYQQAVSCNGFSGDLEDYVEFFLKGKSELSFVFQTNLLNISTMAVTYGVNLEIYRYEDCLPNIERHFFKTVLGCDFEELNTRFVNTSMNIMEVQFHRGINSISNSLGSLLHFERIDTLMAQHIKKFKFDESRYLLSDESSETISAAFEKYKNDLTQISDFAKSVDASMKSNLLTNSLTDSEIKIREQIFELGKFVASSYKSGYINWDWKNKSIGNAKQN